MARPAPRQKSIYACAECGHSSPKWMGQCPSCHRWNTLHEEVAPDVRSSSRAPSPGGAAKPVRLAEVVASEDERIRTGITELDRVLGGGVVPGMLVLLGGDPGIGKSTLLLTASTVSRSSSLAVPCSTCRARSRRDR